MSHAVRCDFRCGGMLAFELAALRALAAAHHTTSLSLTIVSDPPGRFGPLAGKPSGLPKDGSCAVRIITDFVVEAFGARAKRLLPHSVRLHDGPEHLHVVACRSLLAHLDAPDRVTSAILAATVTMPGGGSGTIRFPAASADAWRFSFTEQRSEGAVPLTQTWGTVLRDGTLPISTDVGSIVGRVPPSEAMQWLQDAGAVIADHACRSRRATRELALDACGGPRAHSEVVANPTLPGRLRTLCMVPAKTVFPAPTSASSVVPPLPAALDSAEQTGRREVLLDEARALWPVQPAPAIDRPFDIATLKRFLGPRCSQLRHALTFSASNASVQLMLTQWTRTDAAASWRCAAAATGGANATAAMLRASAAAFATRLDRSLLHVLCVLCGCGLFGWADAPPTRTATQRLCRVLEGTEGAFAAVLTSPRPGVVDLLGVPVARAIGIRRHDRSASLPASEALSGAHLQRYNAVVHTTQVWAASQGVAIRGDLWRRFHAVAVPRLMEPAPHLVDFAAARDPSCALLRALVAPLAYGSSMPGLDAADAIARDWARVLLQSAAAHPSAVPPLPQAIAFLTATATAAIGGPPTEESRALALVRVSYISLLHRCVLTALLLL